MFSRVWCIDRLSALGGGWDLEISPIPLWVGMMVPLGLDGVIRSNEIHECTSLFYMGNN